MKKLIVLLTASAIGFPVHSYELATHGLLTQKAFQRTQLNPTPTVPVPDPLGLVRRLGIDIYQFTSQGSSENPFGDRYFDVYGIIVEPRLKQKWEFDWLDKIGLVAEEGRLNGWLMRGAIREDDIPHKPQSNDPFNPAAPEDPYGDIYRVLNHFYDPIYNRSLSPVAAVTDGCILPGLCYKATDWALGTGDALTDPNQLSSYRRNHFTIPDAREAQYRALTGLRNGADPQYGTFYGDADRKTWWATTFRALGDVVHLIEDMGQPQHTRNEAHGGDKYDSGGILGHKSVIEQYLDNRAMGAKFKIPQPNGQDPLEVKVASLIIDISYPIPRFSNYLSFFTTRTLDGSDDITLRKGLADYSNRSFYTPRKNRNDAQNDYNYPAPFLSGGLQAATVMMFDGTPKQALVQKADLPDGIRGTPDQGVFVATAGAFEQFLQAQGGSGGYTLTRTNYDAMADLLLPRAVAYSAGLIDYFFRGSLEIGLPVEQVYAVEDFSTYAQPGAGFKKLKVMVKNATPPIVAPDGATTPQNMTSGSLYAVIRFKRNTCLQFPSLEGVPGSLTWNETCRTLAEERVVSNPVAVPAGIDAAAQVVPFTLPLPLPFNATDVDLQVIYRGQLGSETDAIAVGFQYLSEPTFFNFDNFSDCASGCSPASTSPSCLVTASVSLPFQGATANQPISIANLHAGQYGRAVFLTDAAYRNTYPDDTYLDVTVNQVYPYLLHIAYAPSGGTTDWQGPVTTSLNKSRPLQGLLGQPNMYVWDGFGISGGTCGGQPCSAFQWAQSCPAIDPTPQPVTVNF